MPSLHRPPTSLATTLALALSALAPLHAATLEVSAIGQSYSRDPALTPAGLFQSAADLAGSTSIRHETAGGLEWKPEGYYQRNRDLGQVFNVPVGQSLALDAVVLRTGNSATAVLPGAAGAPLYVQIFQVLGTPAINDNGTPVGASATHGFTTNHRADDFVQGVSYVERARFEGGLFPNLPATTQAGGQTGHLHYLRWSLGDAPGFVLEGGARYAIVFGIAAPTAGASFTLANANAAADPSAPALRLDAHGAAVWGVRREGDGTLPPTMVPGANPPSDPALRSSLAAQALFAADWRDTLAPTSDGYPDVDTYRALEFYLETSAAPVPEPAAFAALAGLAALGLAASRRPSRSRRNAASASQ
jgi:hypothetical protein